MFINLIYTISLNLALFGFMILCAANTVKYFMELYERTTGKVYTIVSMVVPLSFKTFVVGLATFIGLFVYAATFCLIRFII